METLFTTLLNHQRFDHFHWFLLLFCITIPTWITKDLVIFIDFCCGFAPLLFEVNHVLMPFGMETLFTTLLNHQRLDHFHWFLLLFCITIPTWITKDLIIFIDFCCGFASLVFEVNHVLMPFGMETLFTTLLNHQRFDHVHWFLLWFCITIPTWITKDLIIFIDFCCGFAPLLFEVNHVLMPFGMETLFTTLLNHQKFDHFHWFLLLFCITSPPWITKDFIIFIDFCCGFASLVFEINHVFMPFGMETLITTLLNHQRFDHFHWFLLWFCITNPPWITKDLIIFIDFCCGFASLVFLLGMETLFTTPPFDP